MNQITSIYKLHTFQLNMFCSGISFCFSVYLIILVQLFFTRVMAVVSALVMLQSPTKALFQGSELTFPKHEVGNTEEANVF